MSRILARWLASCDTVDARGLPLPLPRVGPPGRPSLAAERLSIEAYAARVPGGLRLGSGLAADAGAAAPFDAEGSLRVVVVARPGPAGRLDAESVRIERGGGGEGGEGRGGGPGGDRGGPGGPGGGPGGPGR